MFLFGCLIKNTTFAYKSKKLIKMKKSLSILLLFVSASFLFTGCSSDDDAGATASDLDGKWEFFQEGSIINGQEDLVTYEHAAGCSKDNYEFVAGGVFKSNFYDNFDTPCELFAAQGTWSRNGNMVTATMLGETQTIEILTLNATTLKVKYEEDGAIFVDVLRKAAN